MTSELISMFEILKQDIATSIVSLVKENVLFQVEIDTSDYAIMATLSKSGRRDVFFSRTLFKSVHHHASIEKEPML